MISVTVHNKRAIKSLKRLGVRFSKKEYLTLIGLDTVKWINRNFETEGRTGGRKWKKLSSNTIAGGGSKILQRTGALKRSFDYNVVKSSDTVQVGSPLALAKWHQKGTKKYFIRPKSAKALAFKVAGGTAFSKGHWHPGLPARPMLPTGRHRANITKKSLKAYRNLMIKKYNAGI